MHIVSDAMHGRSFEVVVEAWLDGYRRPALRRLIQDARITVNGQPRKGDRKLREGDVLMLDSSVDLAKLPRFEPRRKKDSGKAPVLFEDESCVVIDKPSGLASVPDRNNEPSVHGHLEEWFPGEDLRISHRLDRGTSGVLVLARGIEAARSLDEQFRERQISKRYLALVRGQPMRDEFAADFEIGRTIRGGRVAIGKRKGSREAHTDFRVLRRYRGFTLLEARPTTGRMHQIRAHLMWMRFPLAVDPAYGGADAVRLSEFKRGYRPRGHGRESALIDRLTLHAWQLRFRSPATGAEVDIESAIPRDLSIVIRKLDRFALLEDLCDEALPLTGGE
jgi:RluA family pseudouridine synthase